MSENGNSIFGAPVSRTAPAKGVETSIFGAPKQTEVKKAATVKAAAKPAVAKPVAKPETTAKPEPAAKVEAPTKPEATKATVAKAELKKQATVKPAADLFSVEELEDDFGQDLEKVVEDIEKKQASRAQKALKTVERQTVPEAKEPESKPEVKKTEAEKAEVAKLAKNKPEKAPEKASEKVVEKPVEKSTDESEKKPKKRGLKKKIILAVVALLVILVGAIGFWGHNLISRVTGGNSGIFDAMSALMNASTPFKTDENGRTNILVFGTSGYDMGGSGHDGAQLTDSIMLVSLNQTTGDLAMVSLPRDLYVGNTCTSIGKVNEVFWCANPDNNAEKAGAEALVSQVEKIFGVDVQYWVHLNWGALVRLVDTLGGIDVTLDEAVNDDWTNTYIQPRVLTHLDGEQALGLARARHGTMSGDFTRSNSQQKILLALFDKVQAQGLNFVSALGIVNTLGDNLRTSLTVGEMKTGFEFGTSVEPSSLRQVSLLGLEDGDLLTSDTISGISYVVPSEGLGKYNKIQKYLQKKLSNFLGEGAVISVINASGKAGASMEERAKLEKAGMTVGGTSSITGEYPEKYYLYAINYEKEKTKTALEKMYGAGSRPADELPANVKIEGYDFVIILGRGE